MSDQLGAAVARGQLEALLALQDLDVELQQLRHRRAHLPEQEAVARVEAALAALQAEHDVLDQERSRLAGQRDALDAEATAVGARIEAIEARLASTAAGSFRDQEAMAAEITSLGQRRREIEDRELSVMEELEPVELAVAALAARRQGLEDEHRQAERAYRAAAETAEASLGEALGRRPPLAAAVEPSLLASYDALAERLGGVAVARVVHGTCEGCRLSLSATELDQLRHGGSGRVRCEQCGRILVWLS